MEDWKFQNRRSFIKTALGTTMGLMSIGPMQAGGFIERRGIRKLTILYTNDQHSRIEPFPENDAKYPNEGGFARRATLIEKIRKEEDNVVLLDAGDIFQGTPYFNYFGGEVEYKLMSMMKYDVVTFGNHDFDLGCENILKQMPHATFTFVNCNYDLSETALAKNAKITPYRIIKLGGLRVGVLGVGIELEGLVDKKYVKGIRYQDPVEHANKWAAIMKKDEKCDYVICLSHLGYKYDDRHKVSDLVLSKKTRNIDLIIGGHTHTFLSTPDICLNMDNAEVPVTQVGWAGIWLGRIDVYFTYDNKKIQQNNSVHKI